MIDRMLRLLTSYSILSCTLAEDKGRRPQRLYGLRHRSKYFVDNNGACAAPSLMLLQDKTILENWHSIKDAVKEGGIDLFTCTHGMNVFDYMSGGRDARFTDLFNEVKTVVDEGGGIGETLKIILSNNPHIRAINYDMPHVIAAATPIPGIEHVGGDMVKSVPKADSPFPEGQLIILLWILHCGNDEFYVKVLKNCWEALPPTGKVVIVEVVIPENPRTDKLL
ncbi:hypothetical protein NL676_023665 [Syzygium grande]|nr:hypothetical protein NL676_023665 [Syzygium grande]